MKSINDRTRSTAGFTLLEIMVALAVGGVALSSIYAVGAASTRHFREQQRISAAQTSLRSAMDQLKRDFQRAGFFATPNVQVPSEACGLPGAPLDNTSYAANTGRLAAISAFNNNVTRPTSLDPDDLNKWATVDEVTLMGNYATSSEYMNITIDSDGVTVRLDMGSQNFRRDFTEWSGASAGQCNLTAFSTAFAVGRMVRIHTETERLFFSRVDSVSCPASGPAIVVLTDRVPALCNANGGWIAPVNTIGYRVVNAADTQVSRSTVNRVALLRRTELMPDDKSKPLLRPGNGPPVDDRAVLDYVVSFDLQFLLRGGAPNSVNFLPTAEANVDAFPERLRAVIIDLASRTTEHEQEFDALSLPAGLAFQVFATRGGARVRRLHAELLLPNIAFRNY